MMSDHTTLRRVMDAPFLPRLGKIRLGILKQPSRPGGREYPSEVDYFVLDADLPHRDRIVKEFGEKPKKLLVMFLSDSVPEVFPTAYKAYSQSLGIICRGDGEKADRIEVEVVKEKVKRDGKEAWEDRKRAVTDATGAKVTKPRSCPCPWLEEGKCRAVGNLMVVLPTVALTATYQIDTGSWHSMKNVSAGLHHAKTLTGRVRDILFWLTREPTETHGSGRREVHFPLRLRMLEPEEDAVYRAAIHRRLLQYKPMLAAGVVYEQPKALPDHVEEEDIVREKTVSEKDLEAQPRIVDPEPASVPAGEAGGADDGDDGAAGGEAANEPESRPAAKEPQNPAPPVPSRRVKRGAAPAAPAKAEPAKPAAPEAKSGGAEELFG